MKKIRKKFKKMAAVFLATAMCITMAAVPAFAGDDTDTAGYDIISLLEWLNSDECSVELTTTQEFDVSTALELYGTYSDYFDLDDDDDAANLDNVLAALDEIDTLSALITTDDNFEDYNAYYTNFTMLTGSAYTANISIDAIAHVSEFSSFAATEGLAWGSSDPSVGWYTDEKALFDSCKEALGYTGYIDYNGEEYFAIVTQAYYEGYTVGHYLNLFAQGTNQMIGVGYTTEKGDAGYSCTWSYNTNYFYATISGRAYYTTDEIREVIEAYIEETTDDAHTHTYDDGVVTTEPTCTEDGVMTYTCTVCGATYTEAIAATGHVYGFSEYYTTPLGNLTAIYACENCDATFIFDVEEDGSIYDYDGNLLYSPGSDTNDDDDSSDVTDDNGDTSDDTDDDDSSDVTADNGNVSVDTDDDDSSDVTDDNSDTSDDADDNDNSSDVTDDNGDTSDDTDDDDDSSDVTADNGNVSVDTDDDDSSDVTDDNSDTSDDADDNDNSSDVTDDNGNASDDADDDDDSSDVTADNGNASVDTDDDDSSDVTDDNSDTSDDTDGDDSSDDNVEVGQDMNMGLWIFAAALSGLLLSVLVIKRRMMAD